MQNCEKGILTQNADKTVAATEAAAAAATETEARAETEAAAAASSTAPECMQ